jgi:peptidoglycan/LPS O-acetylase OafA/YrhL
MRTDRLAFLDVLRGIAAMAVVFEHGFAECIPGYLDASVRYYDLGQFGVTLFMLISGFIIPATLERGGSNRRFWINRFFRLFPLYWTTIALFGLYYLLVHPEALYPTEAWQWLANLTMLQDFLRAPHVTPVFWTLTLELLFYASCSILFALRLFRWTALLAWLGQAALFLLGVVIPLVVHRRFPGGYAFLFLSMFVGTMFHRYVHGQASRQHLAWLISSLAAVSLSVSYVSFALFTREGHPLTFHCVWTVWLSAFACFMAALAWRGRAMPGWLSYLGRISYSLYLVHTWLIVVLPRQWPAPIYLGSFVAATIALSSLTYYAIELPCIALGRRLSGQTLGSGAPAVVSRMEPPEVLTVRDTHAIPPAAPADGRKVA